MTSRCIGSPVSWLRLEQYVLGELPRDVHMEVDRHLRSCAKCRACLVEIRTDEGLELPPLPIQAPSAPGIGRGRARWWWPDWIGAGWRWAVAGGALTALAILWAPLLSDDAPGFPELPPSRIRIKGGEVSVGLVRERAGSIANDPETFSTEDRFKVLLTCPPGARVHWEVVVFQSGEPSFPLQRGVSECGNRSVLPGAFRLTDRVPTSVCLLLSEREPPSRTELHRRGISVLPALTVCRSLHPAEPAPHPAQPASLGEDD
jgi:hypothetical protein